MLVSLGRNAKPLRSVSEAQVPGATLTTCSLIKPSRRPPPAGHLFALDTADLLNDGVPASHADKRILIRDSC